MLLPHREEPPALAVGGSFASRHPHPFTTFPRISETFPRLCGVAVSPWASMSDDVNLTSQQLADRLQVHPDTVRAWADSGRIPFYRTPGGHRRFHFYAVREALETGEVQP